MKPGSTELCRAVQSYAEMFRALRQSRHIHNQLFRFRYAAILKLLLKSIESIKYESCDQSIKELQLDALFLPSIHTSGKWLPFFKKLRINMIQRLKQIIDLEINSLRAAVNQDKRCNEQIQRCYEMPTILGVNYQCDLAQSSYQPHVYVCVLSEQRSNICVGLQNIAALLPLATHAQSLGRQSPSPSRHFYSADQRRLMSDAQHLRHSRFGPIRTDMWPERQLCSDRGQWFERRVHHRSRVGTHVSLVLDASDACLRCFPSFPCMLRQLPKLGFTVHTPNTCILVAHSYKKLFFIPNH